ncbi:interleukin-17F-like [Styela clava]
MKTEVMKKSKEYLIFADDMTLERAKQEYFSPPSNRPKREITKCPTMTPQYLRENNLMDGRRSLSPYAEKPNWDPNRYPQFFIQRHCLCNGCIDPVTRKENLSLQSVPLETRMEFFYKKDKFLNTFTTKKKLSIYIGCTCAYPIIGNL